MSLHDNSSHRKQLNINKLHTNMTSDEFLQKTFQPTSTKQGHRQQHIHRLKAHI